MSPLYPTAPQTLLYTPVARPLLTGPVEAAKREALKAYAEDYARRAGYTRGPDGEWITAIPERRH